MLVYTHTYITVLLFENTNCQVCVLGLVLLSPESRKQFFK